MADSEGPSPATNNPGEALPNPAKPLAPAPRAKPPNINAAKETAPAGGPPGFNDFLEWMRGQTGGESAPGSASQRGLIPKEKKKFQRQDTEAKSDKPSDPFPAAVVPLPKELPAEEVNPRRADNASLPPPLPASATDSTSPERGLSYAPEASPTRVRRQQAPLKRNGWLGLLTQIGVLALLAGSFVLGRVSVSKVVALPAAPAAPEVVNSEGKLTSKLLSDGNAALIDQAMAAEQDGQLKKAGELFRQVKASGEHVRGLTFQLAQLAIFEEDYNKALPLLNDALAEGENLADAYNMRATVTSHTSLIKGTAMNEYETATKVDPFGARNFFFWGEALRRTGKDQAALVRLQQAIDRLREPELESLYRLKFRLAQLEAGQEKAFADELARQIALPYPDMDWLITAAAVEIHNGKFDAAAGYLDHAAQRGDASTFAYRLHDYYLYQFKYQKELMRFYANAPTDSPGKTANAPTPGTSPALEAPAPRAIGLEVPVLPPPASPGATVPR